MDPNVREVIRHLALALACLAQTEQQPSPAKRRLREPRRDSKAVIAARQTTHDRLRRELTHG